MTAMQVLFFGVKGPLRACVHICAGLDTTVTVTTTTVTTTVTPHQPAQQSTARHRRHRAAPALHFTAQGTAMHGHGTARTAPHRAATAQLTHA